MMLRRVKINAFSILTLFLVCKLFWHNTSKLRLPDVKNRQLEYGDLTMPDQSDYHVRTVVVPGSTSSYTIDPFKKVQGPDNEPHNMFIHQDVCWSPLHSSILFARGATNATNLLLANNTMIYNWAAGIKGILSIDDLKGFLKPRCKSGEKISANCTTWIRLQGLTTIAAIYQGHIPHFMEGFLPILNLLFDEYKILKEGESLHIIVNQVVQCNFDTRWMQAVASMLFNMFYTVKQSYAHFIEPWPGVHPINMNIFGNSSIPLTSWISPSNSIKCLNNVTHEHAVATVPYVVCFDKLAMFPKPWYYGVNDSATLQSAAARKYGPPITYTSSGIAIINRVRTRRIKNPKELASLINHLTGQEVHIFDDFPKSIEDQVRIMLGLHFVVMPHGAGMTNMIFMSPGAVIVEILPYGHDKRLNGYFTSLSRSCHHHHLQVPTSHVNMAHLSESCSNFLGNYSTPNECVEKELSCLYCTINGNITVDIANMKERLKFFFSKINFFF